MSRGVAKGIVELHSSMLNYYRDAANRSYPWRTINTIISCSTFCKFLSFNNLDLESLGISKRIVLKHGLYC
jgi:hypothetical protein